MDCEAERCETFAGAMCARTKCTVQIQQHEIGFIILPDGQQPVDGVPLELSLDLVQVST